MRFHFLSFSTVTAGVQRTMSDNYEYEYKKSMSTEQKFRFIKMCYDNKIEDCEVNQR